MTAAQLGRRAAAAPAAASTGGRWTRAEPCDVPGLNDASDAREAREAWEARGAAPTGAKAAGDHPVCAAFRLLSPPEVLHSAKTATSSAVTALRAVIRP